MLGAPVARGVGDSRKTRVHRGVELINWQHPLSSFQRPSWLPEFAWPEWQYKFWAAQAERYRDGREDRGIGRKWAARIAAADAREAA
jgi:hypothetical protein